MTKKPTIISILVLVLILACVFAFGYKKSLAPVVGGPTEVTEEKIKSTDAYVDVDVTYPKIPGDSVAIQKANEFMKSEIQKEVALFTADAIQNEKDSIGQDMPDQKSSAQGGYGVEANTQDYISIVASFEYYMRGAAHPYHSTRTYVYDYESGAFLTLDTIFKNGYLDRLSALSRADLVEQMKVGDQEGPTDTQMIEEGTKAHRDNFKHFALLKDGFAIYFEEYQVAPYAAGSQQVVIPYAKLSELMNYRKVFN